METTEKLVPLTKEETDTLKATKSGHTGCFIAVLFVIVAATAFLYVLITDQLFPGDISLYGGKIRFSTGVFVLPLGIVLLVTAVVIHRRSRGLTSKDVGAGMKKVLTTQVVRRFTEDLDPKGRTSFAITTAYTVVIGGMLYEMKEQDFQKYQEGMWVEVHSAPHSGEFLGIYDPGDGKLLTEELYCKPEPVRS